MLQKTWVGLGLTDDVIEELYRRGRDYAERRIVFAHRDDALQHSMYQILKAVRDPTENYPDGPEERLKYLTKTLYREIMHFVSRTLSPDTNIPSTSDSQRA